MIKLAGNKWAYGQIIKFLLEMMRRHKIDHASWLRRNSPGKTEDFEWWNQNYISKKWGIEEAIIAIEHEYYKETGFKIPRIGRLL